MTKFAVPPGYVVVRIADLAELLGRQAQPPAGPKPATATMPGLAEAIALIAARHHGIPSPGLSGDVPPGAVAGALTIFAAALLANLLPADQASGLLTDLGAAVVRESKP